MKLVSPAFGENGIIPKIYTCDGDKINPPLVFSDIPAGTKSLGLIMEDPDVPKSFRPDGMFDHWVVWNMSPTTKEIPQASKAPGVTGLSSSGSMEYVPPCPPDREHRYFFTLYALDDMLQIPPTSGKKDLLNAMEGHIIDSAQLMGRYNRR